MTADLTVAQRGVIQRFGLSDEDAAAWLASGVGQDAFGDWLVDRVARRPAGSRARAVYGAEDVHDFARSAILEARALTPGDHLLEVGCGGGQLLREALRSGATVSAIDHSEEMVALARECAPGANVVLAEAVKLPFTEGTFTAVAMSVVFFFFDDPVGVLAECRRVLAPGGRIAVYTTAPELRGTPAAPEPLASYGHFYTEQQLVELAERAAFRAVRVHTHRGGQLLTAEL